MFGELQEPISLQEFAEITKKQLHAPNISLWRAGKEKHFPVKKVAVCGGSGSSLLPKVKGKADVFVSADFTYHTILESATPLIDAGHFLYGISRFRYIGKAFIRFFHRYFAF